MGLCVRSGVRPGIRGQASIGAGPEPRDRSRRPRGCSCGQANGGLVCRSCLGWGDPMQGVLGGLQEVWSQPDKVVGSQGSAVPFLPRQPLHGALGTSSPVRISGFCVGARFLPNQDTAVMTIPTALGARDGHLRKDGRGSLGPGHLEQLKHLSSKVHWQGVGPSGVGMLASPGVGFWMGRRPQGASWSHKAPGRGQQSHEVTWGDGD